MFSFKWSSPDQAGTSKDDDTRLDTEADDPLDPESWGSAAAL
jgi:hypothetical protein